jgi:nitroreductase
MEFEAVIQKRKTIRRFNQETVPDEHIKKAFEHAILAPNSSNVQNWDFHWVKNPEKKQKLVEACLNQSAARTASHLIVATTDSKQWKRSQPFLLDWVKNSPRAPKNVELYYKKIVPSTYTTGIFNIFAPFKWILLNTVGLFRPMVRGPVTARDVQEVSVKSCALACENFVLSITNSGADSCMMEGFDAWRVKRLLKLNWSSRVVMVIAVGYENAPGNWGERYRMPLDQVVHVH